MTMSVASDCTLTWIWTNNNWSDTVQYWTGGSATLDTIDQGDNWSSWSQPNPGDNLNFNNTTGDRHNPTSDYGLDSYFGNLVSYDGAGGIVWCGDKTWLLSFENNSDANPLVSRADLSNRTGPDSDLAINPLASGGIIVSNVDIQNGMTLQVNGANMLTVNGALTQSGTGNASLAMHGGGTVILNGSNTFAGGTWIDTGTLQIGTGGTSGELGLGDVIDDGTLIYDRSDAQTWANEISGTGRLEKMGDGTLTLGGDNTYAGETLVAGGTLRLVPDLGTNPRLTDHLIHRWSFNGDLGDSVGGQTATIVNGTDVSPAVDAQQVTLPGGDRNAAGYVSLGANILPSTATAPATIELWATQISVQWWARVFEIGGSDANYVNMAWSAGGNIDADYVDIGYCGSAWNTMAPFTPGQAYHIAMVVAPGAGESGQTLVQWYKMDAAGVVLSSGSMSVNWTLADLMQDHALLGVDGGGSASANASYDEVRIWDIALTEAELTANSVLGPDALPDPDAAPIMAPLPPTTTVTLANGGVLDVGDVTNQAIASIATDDPASQLRLGIAGLDLTGDADALFGGIISGIGGLTQHGAGTLTLAGDNTYGGATRILNGALQIGNGGASGALGLGSVLDNGTLVFNRSGTQTWHNAISGTGDLVKRGDGTLTLDGASTYGGATRVEGGTLQLLPTVRTHLAHRWSFNGDLRDSVGGQDATIVVGTDFHATTNANQVTLPGGNWDAADYVSLGANILPDTYAGVTIELWASQLSVQSWSRIFDFGNDPWNHVMMSWTQGGDPNADRVEVSGAGGGNSDNTMAPYEIGVEYHIAMVLTPGAGTASHQTLLQWYKMDASGNTLSTGSMLLDWSLANLAQNNMWLGSSDSWPWWSGDQNANASYNEVRIWDSALTESQLATNSVLGPDALPAPITLPSAAPLPATTTVTFANGGAMDLSNGVVQTVDSIASTDGLGSRIRLDDSMLAVGNGNDATFDGVISGDGSLIKRGDGTLTLTGANTLAGDLVIQRGAVQIGDGGTSGALGSARILDDSALIYNRSDAQTWSNVIAGTGSFEKQGAGTLTLADANTYAGETRIAGGTVQLAMAQSAHLRHRWSFSNGHLGDSAGGQSATIVRGTAAHATTNDTQVTLPGGNWGEADYISLGANILPNAADSATTIELWATQQSAQSWSHIFDFGSEWWNSLFMSWTQGTDYNSEYVCLDGSAIADTMQPYTTNVEYHIAMVITPGAGDNGLTLLQWYKMDAAGTTLGTGSMSTWWTPAQLSQNNMWLGASEPGPAGDQNANASYNEVRIWDIALTEAQLAANSVLGPDALPSPDTLPLVTPLPATTAVTLSQGGTLDLGNVATQTVTAVSAADGSGCRIAIGDATLIAGDWWDATFDGSFDGSGTFVKRGYGMLTLSGINPFGGNLTVDTGTMQVNGTQGASAVSVSAGATLAGGGAVGGTVTCDGTVAPGRRDTIGTLAVTNYTQTSSGTLNIRVGGSGTAGVDYDQLRVAGRAQLGGELYMIVNGYVLQSNDVFTVLQAEGGVSGRFDVVLPPPSDATLSWHVHYGPTSVQLSLVTNFVLQVVSDVGAAMPATGMNGYLPGTVLTNYAFTPYTQGTTQYVCTGWTLAGDTTTTGAGDRMVMTLTGDATLTWHWSTNFWLASIAGPHGQVTPAADWQAAGSSPTVTAEADRFYHFNNWTGDVGGSDVHSISMTVLLDTPKGVTALFAPNLTSNTGTPEWWLDAHYPGTNNFNAAALSDTDHDGFAAWAEYMTGTDPTDARSFFRITTVSNLPSGTFVSFASSLDCVYSLEGCTGLTTKVWFSIAGQTNIPGIGGFQTLKDTNSAVHYHRLRAGKP